MTKIKYSVDLNNLCTLSITDTSGFYNSTTNPFGFLPESDISSPVDGVYKVSQGYFFNVILYNKYNSAAIVANPEEVIRKVDTVDPVYANNFPAQTYKLSQDGSYSIKRYFLISQEFWNANKNGSLFNGKEVYYTNGTYIYHVISGVPTAMSIAEFLAEDLSTMTGLTLASSFISTCYINKCYSKLMAKLLEGPLDSCDDTLAAIRTTRDFLYMTLETIKYLKEFNNITQIQRLLEATSICGGLCGKEANVTSSNCGCNG